MLVTIPSEKTKAIPVSSPRTTGAPTQTSSPSSATEPPNTSPSRASGASSRARSDHVPVAASRLKTKAAPKPKRLKGAPITARPSLDTIVAPNNASASPATVSSAPSRHKPSMRRYSNTRPAPSSEPPFLAALGAPTSKRSPTTETAAPKASPGAAAGDSIRCCSVHRPSGPRWNAYTVPGGGSGTLSPSRRCRVRMRLASVAVRECPTKSQSLSAEREMP